MIRHAISQLRKPIHGVRLGSLQRSDTNTRAQLPLLRLFECRSFAGLNGKEQNGLDTKNGVDVSKFTHEVKVVMPELPDVGEEGKDITGEMFIISKIKVYSYANNNVTLGTILTWYKAKGDLIKKDDVLCDIETNVSQCKCLVYNYYLSWH